MCQTCRIWKNLLRKLTSVWYAETLGGPRPCHPCGGVGRMLSVRSFQSAGVSPGEEKGPYRWNSSTGIPTNDGAEDPQAFLRHAYKPPEAVPLSVPDRASPPGAYIRKDTCLPIGGRRARKAEEGNASLRLATARLYAGGRTMTRQRQAGPKTAERDRKFP